MIFKVSNFNSIKHLQSEVSIYSYILCTITRCRCYFQLKMLYCNFNAKRMTVYLEVFIDVYIYFLLKIIGKKESFNIFKTSTHSWRKFVHWKIYNRFVVLIKILTIELPFFLATNFWYLAQWKWRKNIWMINPNNNKK